MYDKYTVSNLAANCSNHFPLHISLQTLDGNRNKRIFRHEVSWAKIEGYNQVIQGAWSGTLSSSNLLTEATAGIRRCQQSLKQWSQDFHKSQGKFIKSMLDLIKSLQETNDGSLKNTIKQL